jgi:biotin operon repressor
MKTTQPNFLDVICAPAEDVPRLSSQLERVEKYMSDRQWHSLRQIAAATGCLETAASARLRDLRKKGHTVVKRRDLTVRGLYYYKVYAPTI